MGMDSCKFVAQGGSVPKIRNQSFNAQVEIMRGNDMKKYKYYLCLIIVPLLTIMWRYVKMNGYKTEPMVLSQIVYSPNTNRDCELYIKEDGVYTPFFVLSDDYGGDVLLLRKEVIRFMPYSREFRTYYPNSDVDKYLSNEYEQSFSPSVKDLICTTDVEVSMEMPDVHKTERIQRKFFLLSCTEVNIKTDLSAIEGSTLPFFERAEHRIATHSGTPVCWALRSVYTADQGLTWGISSDGTVGGGSVETENGVRPAFCMPKSTQLKMMQFDNGQTGYALKADG